VVDNNTQNTSQGAVWEYRQFAATPVDELMQRLAAAAVERWKLVCVTVEEPCYRAFLKRRAATDE
jgi:hypothetical protein